jgi:hypothetical protein
VNLSGKNTPHIPTTVILHLTAYEDGTDRGCAAIGKAPGPGYARERRPGGAGIPGHLRPGSYSAAFRPARQGPCQGPPPHATLHSLWREVLRCHGCEPSTNSAACECRWNRTWYRWAHCNAGAANASATHPGASLSGGCSTPRERPLRCLCGRGGDHTANYRGCAKWKEAGAALAKQAPDRGRKSAATARPTAPKEQWAGPSAKQMDLGEGWSHVVRGGRVVKATTPLPTPYHPSQPVTEAPERPKVTATSKTAMPQKSEPKSPAAPKPATGKPKKTAVASVKPAAAKPKTPSLVAPKPTPTSPLEDITPLLAHLSLDECVQLTYRFLTSVASLPRGAARAQALLNTVIIFLAEHDSTP